MIAYLKGSVISKETASIIIDAGGIGYEVLVPLSTFYQLPDETEKVALHIYTHVREDMLALYGFYTKAEKDIFKMLISVSGIGPKLAVNILSGIGPQELLEAIARADSVRVQTIPGVGKKTAERIVLELKDRALKLLGQKETVVTELQAGKDESMMDDAMSALLNLGYTAKAAKLALEKAFSRIPEKTLENLIRESLRILA